MEAPRSPDLTGAVPGPSEAEVQPLRRPRRAAGWNLREVGPGQWYRTLLRCGLLLRRLSSWDWSSSQKMKSCVLPDLVSIEDSRGSPVMFRGRRLCGSRDGDPGMEGGPQSHAKRGDRGPPGGTSGTPAPGLLESGFGTWSWARGHAAKMRGS